MAAVAAACALVRVAGAQSTPYSTGFDNSSVIEPGGPYASPANAIPSQYTPASAEGSGFPSYVVFDVSSSGITLPTDNASANPNDLVTAVDPTLTLSFYDDVYYIDFGAQPGPSQPVTLSFYMVTDTTSAINAGTDSPLGYIPSASATYSGGLNGPGLTGGFAQGSSYYFLGNGIYNDSLSYSNVNGTVVANATPYNFVYNLSLPTAAQTLVQNQINDGGNIRIVMTTNAEVSATASTYEASFLGYANTNGFKPTATVGLTTQNVGSNNDSTLFVQQVGTTETNTVYLGRVIQGAAITGAVTVYNTGGATAQYRLESNNADASNVLTDPVGPSNSVTLQVGFNGNDTAYGAGATIQGAAYLINLDNYADDTNSGLSDLNSNPVAAQVNVSAEVVSTRYLDTGNTPDTIPGVANTTGLPSTPNAGKVLVGATASVVASFTTTNPVTGSDTTQYLTEDTVLANVTSHSYTIYDPFTDVALGSEFGKMPNFTQTFVNAEIGTVTAMVVVYHSGVAGSGYAMTLGQTIGLSGTYSADYTEFENNSTGPETVVVGEGIPGENNNSDDVFLYEQWTGYQTASLVANNASVLTPGVTAKITDAVPNDNTYSATFSGLGGHVGTNYYTLGLRAAAWVSGVQFSQGGWSQTGLTTVTFTGTGSSAQVLSGTVITANNQSLAGIVANTGNTGTFTVALSNAGLLNGTYAAVMAIQAENEQDITGAGLNDLPVLDYNVQSTVFYSGGTGASSNVYTLNGGSFIASSPTTLAANVSFAQSSGTSTFASLSGPGTVALSGGAMSVTGGTFTFSSLNDTPAAPGSLTLGSTVSATDNGGVFNGPVTNNGLLTIAGPATLGTISGGGTLAIGDGPATLTLATNSHTSAVGGLSLTPGSKLDIQNNTLNINFGAGADPINTIVSELSTGYHGATAWTGTSGTSGVITSSTAAAGGKSVSVGYLDGNIDPTDSAEVAPNQIVVKYVLTGDTNLDGIVNFTDFATVLKNFAQPGTDWAQGNFTYNPNSPSVQGTNFTDFADVLANFLAPFTGGSSTETLGTTTLGLTASVQTTGVALPEPASLSLVAAGAAGLLARRRRKSRKT